eukprot:4575255-Pleurochrysis_carterae.AAC.3
MLSAAGLDHPIRALRFAVSCAALARSRWLARSLRCWLTQLDSHPARARPLPPHRASRVRAQLRTAAPSRSSRCELYSVRLQLVVSAIRSTSSRCELS